ncbi:MAG: DNA adenine methylase [Cytophagales bacterium]|nr:DNA adenine methylase [Cytophagales bacterium]
MFRNEKDRNSVADIQSVDSGSGSGHHVKEQQNNLWRCGMKKNEFLHSLRGTKQKYKRLSLSPIRYAGGKSLAVGHIVEALPNGIKRIISPFLGGGSIETALNLRLGVEIIACDILEPLVIYWQQQINNPTDLYHELSKLRPDKETYKEVKNQLKRYWETKKGLSDLEVATLYFFNHNLSYGPSFLGWASSVYLDEGRYKKMIERVRDFRTEASFKVSCESFEQLFEKYPTDFFYCDPPYMLKDDCPTSKMFAGIYPQRNFPTHHKGFNHGVLHACLENHKGGFVLSYNHCEKTTQLYKNYIKSHPTWQYTMGQGETRISFNRKEGTNIKLSHEILAVKI